MSLDRARLLDEMGISPQWVLRDTALPVRRQALVPQETPAVETRIAMAEQPVSPAETALAPAVVPARLEEAEAAAPVPAGDWGELHDAIAQCRRCRLCEARKQAVPGVGDEKARWLLIGEGPGAEEDARGEPFVGPAGRLLDAMLAAIDLARGDDVYIANAVKCRPPGNRTPDAAELAACRPYLVRQIALIRPRVILLLGKTAAQSVLGEEGALAGLRGRTFAYRDGDAEIPVVVTYHPAYLLRNLPDKAKAWEDLCRARALMRRVGGEMPR